MARPTPAALKMLRRYLSAERDGELLTSVNHQTGDRYRALRLYPGSGGDTATANRLAELGWGMVVWTMTADHSSARGFVINDAGRAAAKESTS